MNTINRELVEEMLSELGFGECELSRVPEWLGDMTNVERVFIEGFGSLVCKRHVAVLFYHCGVQIVTHYESWGCDGNLEVSRVERSDVHDELDLLRKRKHYWA